MKQPDYENYAQFYDYFELAGYEESEELNIFLNELFRLNRVKTILDFACGTGAQSIGLAKLGYKVLATDKSPAMIKCARTKANKYKNLQLDFKIGDMIDSAYGRFDAAMCIFNSIGHLNRSECQKFFLNTVANLSSDGIFVVDIFNFSAMAAGKFKEYQRLSRQLSLDGKIIDHARECELDLSQKKIETASHTRIQNGFDKPISFKDNWSMQIYDADELVLMLTKAGFRQIDLFGSCGTEFETKTSDVIMAIAQI